MVSQDATLPTKLFVATKAFIVCEGKVLIVRESARYVEGTNTQKYDVVGGRVQPGEHFADGLRREIQEEVGLEVNLGKPFFVGEWRPTVKGEVWQVVGIFFICQASTMSVKLSSDHDDFQWITPSDYGAYALIENLAPVFEAYLQEHTNKI